MTVNGKAKREKDEKEREQKKGSGLGILVIARTKVRMMAWRARVRVIIERLKMLKVRVLRKGIRRFWMMTQPRWHDERERRNGLRNDVLQKTHKVTSMTTDTQDCMYKSESDINRKKEKHNYSELSNTAGRVNVLCTRFLFFPVMPLSPFLECLFMLILLRLICFLNGIRALGRVHLLGLTLRLHLIHLLFRMLPKRLLGVD
jgi:hypothetical protein